MGRQEKTQVSQWLTNELKYSMQALAMPYEVQVTVFPDGVCLACELVEDVYNFSSSYIANCDNLLTEQQKAALDDLQARLDEIARTPDYECWNNDAIRNSQAWNDARELAKQALNCFGWSVEAPPHR